MRLPQLSTSGPVPTEAAAFIDRMNALVAAGSFAQGFVRADLGSSSAFLFILQGKTHCAGELAEDRFTALSIREFFERLPRARSASYAATDLPLFLCTAVLFRKAPSAQIPLDLVDAETLLRSVRETGKDAVLVLRRGDDRNLVFCRNGELTALYPADDSFPAAGTIADRIVEYVLGDPSSSAVTLDIYDEIRLSPARDAERTLDEHRVLVAASPKPSGPTPWLVVRLGGRVSFHFPIASDEVTIGRGEPNDLALDNLSVSRRHAILRKRGEALMIEDLESENGLVVRGRRMKHVELRPGDEVRIGKYTLAYPRYAARLPGNVPRAPASSPLSALESTVSDKFTAIIEHKGQPHPIKGVVFNIGAATKAHLRISGILIAPIHVQLSIQPNGQYRITQIGRGRPLRVNGKRLKSASIKDGDEFTVGSHAFLFRSAIA